MGRGDVATRAPAGPSPPGRRTSEHSGRPGACPSSTAVESPGARPVMCAEPLLCPSIPFPTCALNSNAYAERLVRSIKGAPRPDDSRRLSLAAAQARRVQR